MVKILFLGSCREIGRSSILIESKNGSQCILDYGIAFNNDDRLPYKADINNLKAIALTHCHIDHSGALPILYKTNKAPFFTNSVSLAISEVLIKDMIKISNYPYPFGYREVDTLKKNAYFIKNENRYRIDDNFYITFIEAGHIPGSVSILIQVDKKNILYSGDINTINTNLMKPADSSNLPELDALIIESTYALKEHPPRDHLEEEFIEKIMNITEGGGNVLIPAFGVARSQEALMILNKYNFNGNIYIDGLARKISLLYLEFPKFIKNIKSFRSAFKKAYYVSRRKRKTIVNNSNGVIIAPSGMLRGGAAMDYIGTILKDPTSAIYLVGYQVEGSPGRGLLDNGVFEFKQSTKKQRFLDKYRVQAQCDYDYFDFSSHADNRQLHEYIENLEFREDSNNNVFCIHGDNKSTTFFASELVKKGYNSVAPEIGEVYKV